MRSIIISLFIVISSFLITSCSSSSDSKKKKDTVVEEPPVIEVTTSTINGSINIASNILRDGDLNDQNTPLTQNSTISTAQLIPNIATVQGFATKTNTADFGSSPNDRFYNDTDEDDYYQAQLQAGQKIELQVVNFSQDSSDSVFSGDLDLYLLNYKTGEILFSAEDAEFETLTVPETGLFYIQVNAFSGASRYVLNVLQGSAGTMVESANAAPDLNRKRQDNFLANELIIKFSNTMQTQRLNANTSVLANIKTSHTNPSRETLARLTDTQAPSAFSIQSKPAHTELAQRYPATYEKWMTIQKMKSLRKQPEISEVSLNYIRYPMRTPSDPLYRHQWHYPSINLPLAWDITTGTPNTGSVIVAVVDTGIASSHPDLANKLVPGFDFISSNDNSRDDQPGIDNNPEDPGDSTDLGSSSWHGTHVAGTIAAESNNGVGVAGVSWGAKIMPLRVLGQFGGSTYDIMQAIRFAAGMDNDSGTRPTQPADIINLSLGGAGSSSIEAALYKEIYDSGIIIVAAAGNERSSTPAYPASYEGVISVSATDFNKQQAPYSNYGAFVDIAAPGGNMLRDANNDGQPDGVLSTLIDDSTGSPKAIYTRYQGTSMAAPHVAGVFALMKAVYPELQASTIDTLLQNELITDAAGIRGRDDIYGYGFINALKAVQQAALLANGGELPDSQPLIQATPSSISANNDLVTAITLTNQGGGEPVLISASTNSSWISLTKLPDRDSELARYTVTIDSSSLNDGFYFGVINFMFDSAPTLSVSVNLTVGENNNDGDLAKLYVLLYDINQQAVIDQAEALKDYYGDLKFRFNDVPQSLYLLIAGTDIDNDLYICQQAEGCATYPDSSQVSPIDTTTPSTINIEMTANILYSLNNTEASNVNNTKLRPRFKRIDTTQASSIRRQAPKRVNP